MYDTNKNPIVIIKSFEEKNFLNEKQAWKVENKYEQLTRLFLRDEEYFTLD